MVEPWTLRGEWKAFEYPEYDPAIPDRTRSIKRIVLPLLFGGVLCELAVASYGVGAYLFKATLISPSFALGAGALGVVAIGVSVIAYFYLMKKFSQEIETLIRAWRYDTPVGRTTLEEGFKKMNLFNASAFVANLNGVKAREVDCVAAVEYLRLCSRLCKKKIKENYTIGMIMVEKELSSLKGTLEYLEREARLSGEVHPKTREEITALAKEIQEVHTILEATDPDSCEEEDVTDSGSDSD